MIFICDPWVCCFRALLDFGVFIGRGGELGGAEGGGESQEGPAGQSPRCPRFDQERKGGPILVS